MLTIQGTYELRIDLEDFDNGTAFAHYGSFGVGIFSVDPEEDGYPVSIADYSGTAGRVSGTCVAPQDTEIPRWDRVCRGLGAGERLPVGDRHSGGARAPRRAPGSPTGGHVGPPRRGVGRALHGPFPLRQETPS